jgi:hypothetical protein
MQGKYMMIDRRERDCTYLALAPLALPVGSSSRKQGTMTRKDVPTPNQERKEGRKKGVRNTEVSNG